MQRYMNTELDPADDFEPIETVWTEYDLSAGQAGGDRVYGDYEVVSSALVDVKFFEPGIGFVDDPTGTPVRGYYHGDMLGTTRRTTNASPAQVDNAAYTGFGEFLGGSADRRYGFAGAWQYQSHPGSGFPYLHVGHRYYDPATGRFLQRDPIGVDGGFNVYEYVGDSPTDQIDPSGLQRMWRTPGFGGPRFRTIGPQTEHQRYWEDSRHWNYERGKADFQRRAHGLLLGCTGGSHSWLDNKSTVNRVRWFLDVFATPITWLSPAGGVTTAARAYETF